MLSVNGVSSSRPDAAPLFLLVFRLKQHLQNRYERFIYEAGRTPLPYSALSLSRIQGNFRHHGRIDMKLKAGLILEIRNTAYVTGNPLPLFSRDFSVIADNALGSYRFACLQRQIHPSHNHMQFVRILSLYLIGNFFPFLQRGSGKIGACPPLGQARYFSSFIFLTTPLEPLISVEICVFMI